MVAMLAVALAAHLLMLADRGGIGPAEPHAHGAALAVQSIPFVENTVAAIDGMAADTSSHHGPSPHVHSLMGLCFALAAMFAVWLAVGFTASAKTKPLPGTTAMVWTIYGIRRLAMGSPSRVEAGVVLRM